MPVRGKKDFRDHQQVPQVPEFLRACKLSFTFSNNNKEIHSICSGESGVFYLLFTQKAARLDQLTNLISMSFIHLIYLVHTRRPLRLLSSKLNIKPTFYMAFMKPASTKDQLNKPLSASTPFTRGPKLWPQVYTILIEPMIAARIVSSSTCKPSCWPIDMILKPHI